LHIFDIPEPLLDLCLYDGFPSPSYRANVKFERSFCKANVKSWAHRQTKKPMTGCVIGGGENVSGLIGLAAGNASNRVEDGTASKIFARKCWKKAGIVVSAGEIC
jgi:hypothetical protein